MINCFVSFCGEDVPDVHINLLVEQLEKRTNGIVKYQVYFEQEFGDSLKDFMRETLLQSHAVLMLLGPQYKRRVDNTLANTGAYQEYDTVITRN